MKILNYLLAPGVSGIDQALDFSASEGTSVVLPATANETTPLDDIRKQIDEKRGDKYAVVFTGYSALGYKDIDRVKKTIRKILDEALQLHPEGIVVFAGGTPEGIGIVYEIINNDPRYRDKIKAFGILSDEGKKYINFETGEGLGIGLTSNDIISVHSRNGSWEVTDLDGNSYTPHAAKFGEMHAIGGGEITEREIAAARKQGVGVTVHCELPDLNKLESRARKETDNAQSLIERMKQLMAVVSKYFYTNAA